MNWYGVKEFLEQWSGLDMDSLHVHVGVLGQIAAALVLRRPVRSVIPWLLVLAAALANEAYDYQYEIWPDRSAQLDGGIRDIWNTMLLPSVLLAFARFYPRLFTGAPAPAPESAPDAGEAGGEPG
ncbi:MAG TPA: hypothetical protein VK472_08225 [Allosphingosinicella sp.]|nr:hypothetical protein [Allosphingosinicella sp.]